MVKKITSQDLKKKWEAGLEKLDKLEETRKKIENDIREQECLNQTLQANYITRLVVESGRSIDELPDLLKKDTHHYSESFDKGGQS